MSPFALLPFLGLTPWLVGVLRNTDYEKGLA